MPASPEFGSGTTGTSGYSSWNPDVLEIYEMVCERAGLYDPASGQGSERGGYPLRQFRRDFNLLSTELSNRGLNLGALEVDTIQLNPAIPPPGNYTYQLSPDTLDVFDGYIRTSTAQPYSQTDFKIRRYSQVQYDRIPNKLSTGRPLNWMLQRYTTTITVVFWPVPDTSQPYTFLFTRFRRPQDAGKYTNNVDYPYRGLPVLVAGLSYYMAMRRPALADRLPMLQEAYESQYDFWKRADSDRSSFRITPRSNLNHGW
jgi:hypothetical protein